VLREGASQEGAKGVSVEGVLRVEDEVGGQEGLSRGAVAQGDGGLTDGGVRGEDGLNLAQFDAEAAQLDLRVEAAEELEGAVEEETDEVSGAVEARARQGGERVRKEALSGESRLREVAASQAPARDEELARDAQGNGVKRVVQDVEADVGKRAADGGTGGVGRRLEGGADGDFGGTVGVEEEAAWAPAQDDFRRAGLASGGQGSERGQAVGGSLREDGGSQGGAGDGVEREEAVEGRARGEGVARSQEEQSPGE
jgi:hypothetical protein